MIQIWNHHKKRKKRITIKKIMKILTRKVKMTKMRILKVMKMKMKMRMTINQIVMMIGRKNLIEGEKGGGTLSFKTLIARQYN